MTYIFCDNCHRKFKCRGYAERVRKGQKTFCCSADCTHKLQDGITHPQGTVPSFQMVPYIPKQTTKEEMQGAFLMLCQWIIGGA